MIEIILDNRRERVKEIRSPIERVIEIILDNRRERVKEIRSPIERVIEMILDNRERESKRNKVSNRKSDRNNLG